MILDRIPWFREYIRRANIAVAVASAKREGKLCCEDCGRHLRKRDKYTILAVKHVQCADPKLVGQQSLKLEMK